MPASSYTSVDALLGRPVHDSTGRRLGRIEEIIAGDEGGALVVRAYLVGGYGTAVRLSSASTLPWILRLLGVRPRGGHVVPWDRMDLTDPLHPRTTCPADQLTVPRR